MKKLALAWCVAVMAISTTFVTPAHAGSVFMKNGYILLGRIVELDDSKVVLGFANGKMTVYRRFVTSVVPDPHEEQELLARKVALQAEEPQVGSALERDFELPDDLNEIIPIHDVEDGMLTNGGPQGAGTLEAPDVNQIPNPPEAQPGVEFEDLGVAIVVPEGWDQTTEDQRLILTPKDAPESSRVVIQYQDLGSNLDGARALAIFLEELKKSFPDVQIVSERVEQIGFQRAYVVEGELPGQEMAFTQALVEQNGRYFLMGWHVKKPFDANGLSVLQNTLRSVRFLGE